MREGGEGLRGAVGQAGGDRLMGLSRTLSSLKTSLHPSGGTRSCSLNGPGLRPSLCPSLA